MLILTELKALYKFKEICRITAKFSPLLSTLVRHLSSSKFISRHQCRLFSYGEYLDTIAKLSQLKEKADFYYYLFSESGFDEKIISEAEENDKVKLIGIEEIVNSINKD